MAEKLEIEVSCVFCSRSHKTEIELPAGFRTRYGAIEDEKGFCPDHAIIADFAAAQCPGCVGGWGDCNLFRDFAYSSGRNLSADDFATMRRGICPRRTNGTFMVSASGRGARIEDADISNRASLESGAAFAKAIEDYWATYPPRSS